MPVPPKASEPARIDDEGFCAIFGQNVQIAAGTTPEYRAILRRGQFAQAANVQAGPFSVLLMPLSSQTRIVLVQQGRLNLTEGAKTQTASRGEIFILNDRNAAIVSSPGPCSLFCMALANDYFFAVCGFRAAGFRSVCLDGSDPLQHSLGRLAALAATQIEQLDGDDAQSLCEALLVLVRRILHKKRLKHSAIGNRHDALRFQAVAWMMEHYRDPSLTVQTLAQGLGVSVRTLSSLFQETGQTVAERIAQMRLSDASVRLASRDLAEESIADIAKACGYTSVQTFDRAFKARFGASPAAWRQKNNKSLL